MSVITRAEIETEFDHAVASMEKKEISLTWHHVAEGFMALTRPQVNESIMNWKGKVEVLPANHRTFTRGKNTFYCLTITPNDEDCCIDPFGMFILNFMVRGYIYAFRSEADRDYVCEAINAKNPICCFCGNECDDKYGNNPFPSADSGRCCDNCNASVVLPARFNGLFKSLAKKMEEDEAEKPKKKTKAQKKAEKKVEMWKTITGYENYQISSFGNVRNIASAKVLKQYMQNSGYKLVMLRTDGKSVNCLVHRLVALNFITNPENKSCVDHINNDKLNNNLTNLRWCSKTENAINTGLKINNTSGVKGVYFNKEKKRWEAQLMHMKKKVFIGRYDTLEEAKQARRKKIIELFGEFINQCEL
jgi:hypothetical protein